MHHLHRVLLAIMVAGITALAAPYAAAADQPSPSLAFTRASGELRLDTGVLQGSLGAGGKALGLKPVTHTASGVQVAGAHGILSPYRLLTSNARFGTAAWDWASQAELLPDGAASVSWSADQDHPLDMRAVYRWVAADTLDVHFTVTPVRDLPCFELFLASYFQGFPQALVYAAQPNEPTAAARFMAAVKSGGDWQTFPRDAAAAAIYSDGRWMRPPNPVAWTMMPRLAAPLALRRDAASGLTAVLMSRPADCFAVSLPYGEESHRSVYLSLFGRDLPSGQSATAGARLVLGKDLTADRALALYRACLQP